MTKVNNIKVSIVVCSYNQEKYIRQTLESIISHEHSYSWELIVCDDASQDHTPQIIKEYADLHNEIIPILRKENLGIVKNFFDGVSICKGEYIMICGGDDYYLPGKIKDQIKFLDEHPNIGLVYSDVQTITESGEYKKVIYGGELLNLNDILIKYSVPAPTMAFRRKDLDAYVKDIDPITKNWIMEDLPLVFWFVANHKIAYFPGVYSAYRIVNNSLSHQLLSQKRLEFKKSKLNVVDYFKCKYDNQLSDNVFYLWRVKLFLNDVSIARNHKKICIELLRKSKPYISNKAYIIAIIRIYSGIFNFIYYKIAKLKGILYRYVVKK